MSIDVSRINEIIEKENEARAFSGVVLLRERGETKFGKAYGYANRSEKILNRINTRFGMASGCKIFTAAAICQLVEKGVLTFNTPLSKCLNIVFPRYSPDVTVGHLLTHTSGIPDYFDEAVMDNFEELWKDKPMYNIRSPKDLLSMFQNGEMMFKPGEKFHYNNAGFIVLGLIVEQLSNQRFDEYVATNIFEPCGMADSGYFAMDQLPERTALGYIDDEDGSWKTNIYSVPIIGGPDGGAFTTAEDMTRFWDALFGNKLISEDITKEMLRAHFQDNEYTYYGYGVWIIKRGNGNLYFIQGSDPGVSLMSLIYPEEEVQYSVISNTNYGVWDISNSILAML